MHHNSQPTKPELCSSHHLPTDRATSNDDNMDRISDLPDDILHGVMSLLGGAAEVSRTRALSRRWRRLADSFPELDFLQPSHVWSTHYPKRWDRYIYWSPQYKAQNRRFRAHVHRALAKFLSASLGNGVTRFRFQTALNDPEMHSVLDDWIAAITKVGVREISLWIDLDQDKRVFYALPETTFVRAPAMDGVCSKVHSLRKLFLAHVVVTEKVIEDIARNCPEMYEIFLYQCRGFRNFVVDHRKLEIVKLICSEGTDDHRELERVKIGAKNLRVFCLEHSLLNLSCELSLASCTELRELTLTNYWLPGEWLQQNLPRFSLLEDLVIANCHNVKDIRVFYPRLRSVHIYGSKDIKRIEIDAPNLSLFRLNFYVQLPVLLVKNAQCVLDIGLSFYRDENMINTSRFLKFREFLAASEQRKTLKLDFYLNSVLTFDHQELGEAIIPHRFEVEDLVLDLGLHTLFKNRDDLLNGLLWSCHPKRVSFKRYGIVEKRAFEALGRKLFNKDNPSCCDFYFHDENCWRNDLKSVKIFIITDGEEREIHTYKSVKIFEMLPSQVTDFKMAYKLEWFEP